MSNVELNGNEGGEFPRQQWTSRRIPDHLPAIRRV